MKHRWVLLYLGVACVSAGSVLVAEGAPWWAPLIPMIAGALLLSWYDGEVPKRRTGGDDDG